MKKFFARIKQFLRNFFGYTNTTEIQLQTAQIKLSSSVHEEYLGKLIEKIETLTKAINLSSVNTINALQSIFDVVSQRPIVPIIMNDKGYLLNLAIEKKAKLEVSADENKATFKLIVDHTHTFFDITIDMGRICIENINNKDFAEQLPIMQYARVLLKVGDKKRAILDRISLIAMNKLVVRAQHQMIDESECYYIFADTILGVVKPLYDAKDKEQNSYNKLDYETQNKIIKIIEKTENKELRILSDEEMNRDNIQEPQNDNKLSHNETQGNDFGITVEPAETKIN